MQSAAKVSEWVSFCFVRVGRTGTCSDVHELLQRHLAVLVDVDLAEDVPDGALVDLVVPELRHRAREVGWVNLAIVVGCGRRDGEPNRKASAQMRKGRGGGRWEARRSGADVGGG